jgi:hypothetical protein
LDDASERTSLVTWLTEKEPINHQSTDDSKAALYGSRHEVFTKFSALANRDAPGGVMKACVSAVFLSLFFVSCGSQKSEFAAPAGSSPPPPVASGTVFGKPWKFTSGSVFSNGGDLIVRIFDVEVPKSSLCDVGWMPPANATRLSFNVRGMGSHSIASISYGIADENARISYGAVGSNTDLNAEVMSLENGKLEGRLAFRVKNMTLNGEFTATICK